MIELANVTAGWSHSAPVFQQFDCTLPSGGLIGIIGPNGSGKSTLLRLLAGLLRPTAGRITLADLPVFPSPPRREVFAKHVAYLPQTMLQNLALTAKETLGLSGLAYREKNSLLANIAELCNIEPLLDSPLAELSGGQQRRVQIALTLAQRTPIVLLDEPTGPLDARHSLHILSALAADSSRAVLFSTHNINLAARVCSQILLLKNGSLVCVGSPNEALTKSNLKKTFATDFHIGSAANQRFALPTM